MIYYVFGHHDLTEEEFSIHYIPKLEKLVALGVRFVVADSGFTNLKIQNLLRKLGGKATIYHTGSSPQYNVGFPTKGNFKSKRARNVVMTGESNEDLYWCRPGQENCSMMDNVRRREGMDLITYNRAKDAHNKFMIAFKSIIREYPWSRGVGISVDQSTGQHFIKWNVSRLEDIKEKLPMVWLGVEVRLEPDYDIPEVYSI